MFYAYDTPSINGSAAETVGRAAMDALVKPSYIDYIFTGCDAFLSRVWTICRYDVKNRNSGGTGSGGIQVNATCQGSPGNIAIVNGVPMCKVTRVTCPAGQVQSTKTGYCQKDCAADKGKPWGDDDAHKGGAWKTDRAGAMTFCDGGCAVKGSSNGSKGGWTYIYGPWTSTGGSCGPSDGAGAGSGNESNPPTSCGPGKCPGTINGTSVCVACKGVTESSSGSSNSNSSSTGATAKDASGNDIPGSTTDKSSEGTVDKVTSCEDGKCTTKSTTTEKNSDGSSASKTETVTESMADFCNKNPNAIVCKVDREGTWGGSCASGYQCSGDAVQCAQAQAAWQSYCSTQPGAGDTTVGDGQKSTTGQMPNADPRSTHGSLDVGSFDQSNPYPTVGPSDLVVPVGSHSFTIPFSKASPFLAFVGYCAVLGSLLGATRYVLS
ncbi:hypothetical protein [Aquabacterium sp.]|uniref:hypothetical protein n=1 Tax=Aquabacterium sp. TaxID=1872578 RepID=UPI003BF54995